jgi:hypothetical protein
VLSSISDLIGRRLGASMEGSAKQNGECPYCRDPFEARRSNSGLIAYHLFFACPNCRLASISRTMEHDKFWLFLSNVAQAMGAFVLTSKMRSAKTTDYSTDFRR